MRITIAQAQFRPISIVLENQDELDKLMWILGNVSNNVINNPSQLIKAAGDMRTHISQTLIEAHLQNFQGE